MVEEIVNTVFLDGYIVEEVNLNEIADVIMELEQGNGNSFDDQIEENLVNMSCI